MATPHWIHAANGLILTAMLLVPAGSRAQGAEEVNEPGDSVDPPPVEAVEAPLGPVEPPALIPREVLFGNPDRTQASISPDGKWISYLAPLDGVLNAWVAPVDDLEAAKPITQDAGRGIRRHGWAHTSQHVLYTQDREGDENWHVYSVDLDTKAVLDLTPFDGVQARIGATSRHFPTEILVYVNKRSRKAHDLYRVDVTTGEMTLVHKNKQRFTGIYLNEHFEMLFGHRIRRDGALLVRASSVIALRDMEGEGLVEASPQLLQALRGYMEGETP